MPDEDVVFDPPAIAEVWLDGGTWWPAQLHRWTWRDADWWGDVTIGAFPWSLPAARVRELVDEDLRTLD